MNVLTTELNALRRYRTDLPDWIFIPTPGDHYSPRTGSANISRIQQLARHRIEAGGQVRVIVARGTMAGYNDGEIAQVGPCTSPTRLTRLADAVQARAGLGRYHAGLEYKSAAEALSAGEHGVVFVYNNPAAVLRIRRRCPYSTIVLYLGNCFPLSYGTREARRVARAVDHVICVSRYVEEDLVRRYGRVFQSTVVVNGVDLDVFHPSETEPEGDPVILFVGRMQAIKGPDLLIRAATSLVEKGYRFRLQLVGSQNFSANDPLTAYERQLREQACAIADRVEFTSFVDRDRIPEIYRRAHIYCAPCRWDDPCPNTVLEAMASGLPVVAARRGGIPELIDGAGKLCDPETTELDDALEQLLCQQPRQLLARAARRRANQLSWRRQYETLANVVDDTVVQQKRSSRPVVITRVNGELGTDHHGPPHLVHIPTPGDHYSPATGSAIITIVYEMSRIHDKAGGKTSVLVSRSANHAYDIGQRIAVQPSTPPRHWFKGVDVALGWMNFPRVFGVKSYHPHVEALDPESRDVILVHNNPVAIGALRARAPQSTICLWANNELWTTYRDREVRQIAAMADRLICCSRHISAGTQRRLPAEMWRKVRVVHNGVDTLRFQPVEVDPDGPPSVTFIGRIVQEKGADLILRAAALLDRSVDDYQIRIVGSSGFSANGKLSRYERLLRKLAKPLRDRVVFVPFRDRAAVMEEYAKASIFCVPSNWDDPCPLTVLEGMACGLPVVASRRGGIPEESGDAALLFDPLDIRTLADALTQLLRDERARRDLGRRARERSLLFSWERQYEVLMRAIREDDA